MDANTVKDTVDELSNRVGPKIEEARQEVGRINGRITSSIQNHPAAYLMGAAALGYLVARIARRQHRGL